MDLKVGAEEKDGISVITCEGIINSETFSALKDIVEKLVKEDKCKIVVDLTNIIFISSAGWGVFTGTIEEIRGKKGDIKLVGLKGKVKDVYNTISLNKYIKSYKNVENAVKDF